MSLLAFLLTLGDELCALYISIIFQKLCMFITLINNLLQHICVKCQGNSALLESKRLWLILLVLVCHYLRHTFIFVCIHSCVNSLIHSFIHLPNVHTEYQRLCQTLWKDNHRLHRLQMHLISAIIEETKDIKRSENLKTKTSIPIIGSAEDKQRLI